MAQRRPNGAKRRRNFAPFGRRWANGENVRIRGENVGARHGFVMVHANQSQGCQHHHPESPHHNDVLLQKGECIQRCFYNLMNALKTQISRAQHFRVFAQFTSELTEIGLLLSLLLLLRRYHMWICSLARSPVSVCICPYTYA